MKTRQSTSRRLGLALACGFLTFAATHFSAAQSTNVIVPGVASILLAGQPDGTSLYGDVAPINSPVAIDLSRFPGAVSLAILATGATSRDPHTNSYPLVDPDGETNLCSAPPVFDLSGLESTYCCLAGVFLVSHATLPRPATLRFVTEGEKSFSALSPLVQQVFFIGDGLTGRGIGQLQSFTVPAGADKLYLGLFDFGGIGGKRQQRWNVNGDSNGNECRLKHATYDPQPARQQDEQRGDGCDLQGVGWRHASIELPVAQRRGGFERRGERFGRAHCKLDVEQRAGRRCRRVFGLHQQRLRQCDQPGGDAHGD